LENSRQSVRIFLDSSVIISACSSEKSLSCLIAEIASERDWELVSSAYCRAEVTRNIGKFGDEARAKWEKSQQHLRWVQNALTSTRPLLLSTSKDKPVLISALAAHSQILLTLDTGDFELLLGTEVYGMLVATPRDFLVRQGLG
jgi:predicted nucleic acid-binding protein